MDETPTNYAPVIGLLTLIFAGIGIAIVLGRQQVNYRKNHPVYTSGTITGYTETGRGSKYVHYRFIVDTVEYKGSISITFCSECKRECCAIGQEVKVRYADGDPSNNDLVH